METNNASKKNQIWQYVLIGGVPGILMGSAGTIAAQNIEIPETPVIPDEPVMPVIVINNEIPVANVSDDQSFASAFADAREQLGPGGMFVWHGNIYNTYTAAEWASMSQDERDSFVAQCLAVDVEVDVVDVNVPEESVDVIVTPVKPDEEGIKPEEPEVVYLGTETIVAEDGNIVTLEHYNIDGHAAMAADLDGDLVADVLAVDLNDNMEIDDDEVVPLEPDQMIAMNDEEIGPDYVNDADTSAFA